MYGLIRPHQLDLVGKKFTNLLVLKRIDSNQHRRRTFLCLCDCGKKTIVIGSKIKNGSTKSCGCIRRDKRLGNRIPIGIAPLNRLISNYKGNAKHKKLDFELSNKELCKLFSGLCYYCGSEPSSIMISKKCYGKYTYNGIDRLDNSKGYVKNNCVSCCKECNYRKNKTHYKDFKRWIYKVHANLEIKKLDLKR